MNRTIVLTALTVATFATPQIPAALQEEAPYGLDHRISWSTSRVVGSPDPPLAYTVEQTFTNILWKAPIFIAPEPESDFLLVAQQGGEPERPSRILRVRDDPKADQADTFLILSNRLIYSFAFDPGYRTNHHLYLFTHGSGGNLARTNYILRFTVETRPSNLPQCDPSSELSIIEWHSEGHDGGGIVFGNDGMLYVSAGDGTTDSDGWVTGQDLGDLLGSVLRIDVHHPEANRSYSIPRNNPFLNMTNARPEIWAYGLRNPWRLSSDQKTGQIWVGNNGQDAWETAHLLRPGENYGWSVYEGSHPFYLNRRRGPTPIVAPTIEHPHSEMRSLTGGHVYYGARFPELNGVYIYGDYSTAQIWGARHNGSRLTSWRQLAQTQLQLVAFAVDHRGDFLIADLRGGIYRLVRAIQQSRTSEFPTRLSKTGLFLSTKDHRVQPALVPYSVNAPAWADGAYVQRFMALPDDSRLGKLTNGAVLVQTLSLELEQGNPASSRRIETRLLTRQMGQWVGYSYRWNDNQSDATLVGAKGDEKEFVVRDKLQNGGIRRQLWRYPSRAECMSCHSRAADYVLGLSTQQLNKMHDYGGIRDNQLRTLRHIGVFAGTLPKQTEQLPNPYNPGQKLEARARAYLHVNCSVCHVGEGGGNAKMEMGFTTPADKMNVIGARPQHETFGIDNAMLVFPGDPARSILYQRLLRRGRGQMPPLVSTVADQRALALFGDWIRSLKPEHLFVREWQMEDLLPMLGQIIPGRSGEPGRAAFRQAGCGQCHRFGGEGGSVGPDLSGVARRLSPHDLLESILLPSKIIAEGYATTEIETKSGEEITGRIEREDDRVVLVRPQAAEAPVSIRKKDIRRRGLSRVSNMPTGTLNALNETQIIELLTYLMSDVERSSK